jgi:nucleoside-diphosphate-sugar epimerase
MPASRSIVIAGAAGLVGQNLVLALKARGHGSLIGIDKHPSNTKTLARLNPDVQVIEADLATPGPWQQAFSGAGLLILNHAQFSALEEQTFIDNNVTATANVLAAAKRHGLSHVIHISSSSVNSIAQDHYAVTKKIQEKMVVESGMPCCVLRPTLMFGWFDRKHLSWLGRFMARTPLFPIPGQGRYVRQPLFVRDFCDIIASCVEKPRLGEAYNISGQEKIDYIDLIRSVRDASGVRTPIVRIPYRLFRALLEIYALIDRNPPFTVQQLEALVASDEFEVIDWPSIFGVRSTPLIEALRMTFHHPTFSKVVLEF